MSGSRTFLFLQGVCSPFFPRLADRLKRAGHEVHRVNFNGGDLAYWGTRPGWLFRRPLKDLGHYLEKKYQEYAITDQLLFGDCRPVHRVAVEKGKKCGVHSHVFEEGYFRPYWFTLERGGVNGYSLLPRDPDWYRKVGQFLPDYGDGVPFPSSFYTRATHDVLYHLAGLTNVSLFPHYRTHAPVIAPLEYIGYLRRLPFLRFHRRRDNQLIRNLSENDVPFFVFPLQLNGDAQIIHHSTFKDMVEVIEYVVKSFGENAPEESRLVIKNHPLDMGLINYSAFIKDLEGRFELKGRLKYIETGDLKTLLMHARGTVTVNSTVGPIALGCNCPTFTLADPVYNIKGLTAQTTMEQFWQEPEPPDGELFRIFSNTVIHCTQVNGGFYSKEGIDLAVKNCLPLLLLERSPLEEFL